jgi:hypothetical protein
MAPHGIQHLVQGLPFFWCFDEGLLVSSFYAFFDADLDLDPAILRQSMRIRICNNTRVHDLLLVLILFPKLSRSVKHMIYFFLPNLQ